jgi:hypothetical protein
LARADWPQPDGLLRTDYSGQPLIFRKRFAFFLASFNHIFRWSPQCFTMFHPILSIPIHRSWLSSCVIIKLTSPMVQSFILSIIKHHVSSILFSVVYSLICAPSHNFGQTIETNWESTHSQAINSPNPTKFSMFFGHFSRLTVNPLAIPTLRSRQRCVAGAQTLGLVTPRSHAPHLVGLSPPPEAGR